MTERIWWLALPSVLVLLLLVIHSLKTLPIRRALAFWVSVVLYGMLRGAGVRWISAVMGAQPPYEVAQPLVSFAGVSLQEVMGWAIVAYLGWWLGARFAFLLTVNVKPGGRKVRVKPEESPLFVQVAWASLFLGAISWMVETAAVAAGWWRWTVPAGRPLLLQVPFIGLVDWFFVGSDFLLPFLALTAPALRGRPWRFLTLLSFPIHFAAHAFTGPLSAAVPIPVFHLAHWGLLALQLGLALRSSAVDRPFAPAAKIISALPIIGLAMMMGVAAAVDLAVAGRPVLLASIGPLLVLALITLRPAWSFAAGLLAAGAAFVLPSLGLSVIPPLASGLLRQGRGWGAGFSGGLLGVLALTVYAVHAGGARSAADFKVRLEAALQARDRGDLQGAADQLAAITGDYPGEHAAHFLLGELDYRAGRVERARGEFLAAQAIKPDHLPSLKHLAVIELQGGRNPSAGGFARRGLALRPGDPELRYLAHRADAPGGDDFNSWMPDSPAATEAVAALAFEVNDPAGAAAALDRGLARWPEHRAFYPQRVRLALAAQNPRLARSIVDHWLQKFPQDPEALELSARLELLISEKLSVSLTLVESDTMIVLS